jgi:hypothetical protein
MPKGAFPWNKTVYAVRGVPVSEGPILFRGARLDGTGRLQFSGDRVSANDKGQLLSSDGAASDLFYDRVLQQNSGGGAFYLYPSMPGCYGLQLDAPAFEDVIVISAT